MLITLNYEDIFLGTIPSISDLLKNISSKDILFNLSMINGQLYFSNRKVSTINIIRKLFIESSHDEKFVLSKALEKVILNPELYSLFNELFSNEFIHYVLCNYK